MIEWGRQKKSNAGKTMRWCDAGTCRGHYSSRHRSKAKEGNIAERMLEQTLKHSDVGRIVILYWWKRVVVEFWSVTLEWGTEAPLAGSSGCRPSRESLQIVLTGVLQRSDTYSIHTVESYCILAYHHFFSLRSFPPLVLAASYCAAKSSQFHSTLLPAIANNVNSGGNLVCLCICPSGALCLVFRLPLYCFRLLSSCITNTTLAMPPMRTGGTAMMMQPKAAIYEVSSALLADLLESTLWK